MFVRFWKSFTQIVRNIRLTYALTFTLILLIILDIGVRKIETIPDLILRNEGHRNLALEYMFARLEKISGRRAVWLGGSVEQGLGNTIPEMTAANLSQKILRQSGLDITIYNMAKIGNRLGDHFAITTESIRKGADVIVFPLSLQLFSSSLLLGKGMNEPDLLIYLKFHPQFTFLRRNILSIPDYQWDEIQASGFVKQCWALYKYRDLISYLLTGSGEDMPTIIQNAFIDWAGIRTDRNSDDLLSKLKPEEKNRDNLWMQTPPAKLFQSKAILEKINLSEKDPNIILFTMINMLAKQTQIPILFYLSPVNRECVDANKLFSWDKYDHFKETITSICKQFSQDLIDCTDIIPAKYFTDMDHLNMNGHAMLAKALATPIYNQLIK